MEILEEYGEEMSDSYWDKWEKREYKGRPGGVSWVDAGKLKEEAERVGVKDMRWVDGVCERLEKGAVQGCRREGRWPSSGSNNKSAYEEGSRMADALQHYVKEGYMYGPFTAEEMPWESGRQVL